MQNRQTSLCRLLYLWFSMFWIYSRNSEKCSSKLNITLQNVLTRYVLRFFSARRVERANHLAISAKKIHWVQATSGISLHNSRLSRSEISVLNTWRGCTELSLKQINDTIALVWAAPRAVQASRNKLLLIFPKLRYNASKMKDASRQTTSPTGCPT